MVDEGDIDRDVRVALFDRFARTGAPPAHEDVAAATGLPVETVVASYRRLADAHVIVLRPGTDELWMANPFSAVPTPFTVEAGGREYRGNCIWDGLGILALLDADGDVRFPCPDCGDPLAVAVRGGEPAAGRDLLVHFAVPAAAWWDDIGHT